MLLSMCMSAEGKMGNIFFPFLVQFSKSFYVLLCLSYAAAYYFLRVFFYKKISGSIHISCSSSLSLSIFSPFHFQFLLASQYTRINHFICHF